MHNYRRSRSFALNLIHPHNKGMFMSVVFLGGIIGALLLAFVAFGNDVDHNPSSLQLVVILHRHGDRTPTQLYENDPYKDVKKYWPIGLGQLTSLGKQQLFKLGQMYRAHYKSYLSTFDVRTVRVDSSNVDRALMSAAALLAGWFPPVGDQVWNPDLNWQPIPIHTVPREQDKLISLKAPCPKYLADKVELMNQLKENQTAEDKEFFKYLTKHSGQEMGSFREAETLYSILFIENLNKLELPKWTEKIFPSPLKEKAAIGMAIQAWNTELKRLHGGNFLNEILKHFDDKSKGKSEEMKLFLYSGHDVSIVTIWRTLGFDEFILPAYGASLIWELHKYSEKYFVKMFYLNNTVHTEPYELHIPKCEQPCPLNMLFDVTKDVRPINWEKECQINHRSKNHVS